MSGHALRLIEQLREFEEDDDLDADLKRRARERREEIEDEEGST